MSKKHFNGTLNYVDELYSLNLKSSDYVIFGSGPLAIRDIRINNDIDIIVNDTCWDRLINFFGIKKKSKFRLGNIEICKDWLPYIVDTEKIIQNSELINNLPYAQLDYVVEWKSKHMREKDLNDLELIKTYLSKNKF